MTVPRIRREEETKRNKLKEKKPYVYEKVMKFNEKIRCGESIAIIQFQCNYECNFFCKHCSAKRFQGRKDKRRFTVADVKNLAQQADEMGLARFVMTGGEPLMFKDLDAFVAAIDPQKFYINLDTNGWFLDEKMARHLKSIGVDRVQLSIDSLDAHEHDSFRKAGSYERAMRAVDATLNAGLGIFIQTVVTKQRLYSDEFIEFIEYFNRKGIDVFVTYAKPVGAWEGNFDVLVNKEDINYMRNVLEKKYNVFTHLTPAYGLNMGCIGVKGMISVTEYGDVMPCPYIHTSIGNVFNEPLKDIIQRGLNIKYFGEYVDTCLIAEDKDFINNYVAKKIYGKPLPVFCSEVFTDKDKTRKPFNKDERLFQSP
jgi:MoaA/NifB/PqqE/SkfB family radical SAM enzyme